MYFPTFFKRQKGSASADPALGASSDPAPAFADGENKTTSWKDAKLFAKVGGIGNPIRRVAVGYWFDDGAAGVGAVLTATLWVFDQHSKRWYQVSSGSLTHGQLAYFRVPYLADPPQTSANLGGPTAGGLEALLIVADPGAGAATGVYNFVMGPDLAEF